MFHLGCKNVLITNPRDMKGFLRTLAGVPFSLITGVNTLFNGMLNHPDFAKVDTSHLKICCGRRYVATSRRCTAMERADKLPYRRGIWPK